MRYVDIDLTKAPIVTDKKYSSNKAKIWLQSIKKLCGSQTSHFAPFILSHYEISYINELHGARS
jgi:hypothetical protein